VKSESFTRHNYSGGIQTVRKKAKEKKNRRGNGTEQEEVQSEKKCPHKNGIPGDGANKQTRLDLLLLFFPFQRFCYLFSTIFESSDR
jgi:hypothetical protein